MLADVSVIIEVSLFAALHETMPKSTQIAAVKANVLSVIDLMAVVLSFLIEPPCNGRLFRN